MDKKGQFVKKNSELHNTGVDEKIHAMSIEEDLNNDCSENAHKILQQMER